jgi:non-canonical (house-cleaning) NTP pyrophosphatase
MSMKDGRKLDAKIKDVKIECGAKYEQCFAKIVFDISDGKGGREDLAVKYPIQGDRHLVMLMRGDTELGDTQEYILDHKDIQNLAAKIREAAGHG